MQQTLGFLFSIGTIVVIYAILVLALNIRWGFAGLLDFGIAGFFAVGAYTSAILTLPPATELRIYGETFRTLGFGLPIPVGFLAAAVSAGLAGFVVGIPALRLRGDFLAIATIGLSEVIRYVALNERWLTRGAQGLRNIPRPFAGGSPFEHDVLYFALSVALLAVVYFVCDRVYHSPFGRVLRGIREDEVVTESLGKHVFRFRMLAFVLGAALAGVAGALWAHYAGAIIPSDFAPDITFLVWTALILGGSGSNRGALLGTVLLIGLFHQGTRFIPSVPGYPYLIPALRLILVGVLMILGLRFLPRGVSPERPSRWGEAVTALTPIRHEAGKVGGSVEG